MADCLERERYDVVVFGAGLAGLSLARQLLLETEKTVLLVERLEEVPPPRQKVGESTVQLAGFYFSKVLDTEEHLFTRHFMKHNLRFSWKSAGSGNARLEDYSQAYIRQLSNVASFQLDRNAFEAELLRLCRESPRFHFAPGVKRSEVELGQGEELHRVGLGDAREVEAGWIVDATGRARLLARRLDLKRRNPIRHGSFFWWVEGLVDVERLTDRSRREVRRNPQRRVTGHLPHWLATNHFMGEGLWFWVIPLQGKTSLGLVYDTERVQHGEVFSVEKATEWVCREFPLFARDLPQRKVLDSGGFRDFSYDCAQTLAAERWALAGEAGRFSDPLYSPGSDLIAIHNTLIVDAIETSGRSELEAKCQLYEQLMRTLYAAYVPGYARGYGVLGDPETFSMKYAWELTVYFGFYVFPFLNELLTERRFALGLLRSLAKLGPINRGLQELLSGYCQWKKENVEPLAEPTFFDFTELAPLRRAEKTFYRTGATVGEAKAVLAEQLENARELARFLAAHVYAAVTGDERALRDRGVVESIDLEGLRFDREAMHAALGNATGELHPWSFEVDVLDRFRAAPIEPNEREAPETALAGAGR